MDLRQFVLSDPLVLQSYPKSSQLEWLETNGSGSFAIGTVCGANTRRTHGKIIAPSGQLLLSKFDEELVNNGHRTGLGVNAYPGTLHPRGHRFLTEFRLDPYPRWRYQVEGTVLERSLFLVPGHTTVVVEWRLLAGAKCWLEVRPFFACRPQTELRRAAPLPPVMPPVQHSEARVFEDGYWYFQFEYDTGHEDLFSPAVYQFRLTPEQPAWAAVSAEDVRITSALVYGWREQRLRRGFSPLADFRTGVGQMRSGYPSPGGSLEEALIALPADEAEARRILARALAAPRPSLWLFPALVEYQRRAGEDAFLAEAPMARAVEAWLAECDGATGLLVEPGAAAAGSESVAAMAPTAPMAPVVPIATGEQGQPAPRGPSMASIAKNALWLNALLIESMFADAFGRPRRDARLLRRALASFEPCFWPTGKVVSLDATQILAVSLPFALVEEPLQREIVEAAGLTPVADTWLLGHYLHAYLRVHEYSAEAVEFCRREWARVEASRWSGGCLGHLPMEQQCGSAVRLAEHLRIQALLAGLPGGQS